MRFSSFFVLLQAVSGFDLPFMIKDSLSKGKVAVATRDILPGELVLEEKEPLLFYPFKQNLVKRNGIRSELTSVIGLFEAIKLIDSSEPSKVNKILSLFGPVERSRAELSREVGRDYFKATIQQKDRAFLPSCEKDLDLLVKINMVVKFNSIEDQNGCYLFDNMSRFSHSCAANCIYHLEDRACFALQLSTSRQVKN